MDTMDVISCRKAPTPRPTPQWIDLNGFHSQLNRTPTEILGDFIDTLKSTLHHHQNTRQGENLSKEWRSAL